MGKALKYKRAIILGGNLSEINPEICGEINNEDFVICADSGYIFALDNNIVPNVIVGDFDSAPYPKKIECEIIKLPTHKNDTDLLFAIKLALEKGCSSFILTGVTGGRLDHTIATISTLDYLSEKTNDCFIWDVNSKVYIVKSEITLKKPNFDCYFSVFSLTDNSYNVNVSGAEYPLNNATLTNTFPLGVSNEFKDSTVQISLKSGKLIVLIVKKD